jgi:hypothetical protein
MEDASEEIFQVFRNVLTQLPSLLTLLVCLIVALVRWKRHPRVSLIASVAFVLLILHALTFSAAYIWIPRFFYGLEADPGRMFFFILAHITNGLLALAFGTLLMAVFIDRARTVNQD